MLRVLMSVLCILVPAASFADTTPGERRVLTIDEQRDWSGVGRLNHSRGGFCSGALIAPDTVLTAAHCVVDEASNRPVRPDDLRFVAGLRTGVYMANRRGAAAKTHPDWSGYQGDGEVFVAGDLATVKLEAPITNVEAKRFAVGAAPVEGDAVTLVSYGRGREGALSIQQPCYVLRRFAASLELNCDSVNGTSGAPVFKDGKVVAVISASEKGVREDGGPLRSYAVILEGALGAIHSSSGGAAARGVAATRPTGTVSDRFRPAPTTGGGRLPGSSKAPTQ